MDNWKTICSAEELTPNAGNCALIFDQQVAIFNCQRTQSLYAVSNYDPIGKANIISRGIIGSIDNEPYVASPLYKQHFHLRTGQCLEDPEITIATFPIRSFEGEIQVQLPTSVAA